MSLAHRLTHRQQKAKKNATNQCNNYHMAKRTHHPWPSDHLLSVFQHHGNPRGPLCPCCTIYDNLNRFKAELSRLYIYMQRGHCSDGRRAWYRWLHFEDKTSSRIQTMALVFRLKLTFEYKNLVWRPVENSLSVRGEPCVIAYCILKWPVLRKD